MQLNFLDKSRKTYLHAQTLDFNQFEMLGFPEEKLVKPYFIINEVDAHNRQYQSADNYPFGQKTSSGSLIYTLISTIQCNLATPFLKHKQTLYIISITFIVKYNKG